MAARTKQPVSLTPLQLMETGNPKAQRLLYALGLAPAGYVLEVGCLRTPSEWPMDGWSTVYLARACEEQGRQFTSCDIDPVAVGRARHILQQQGIVGLVEEMDAIELLSNTEGPIALLYLDGSDDPAEALAQLEAAIPLLAKGAVLCINDAQMFDWDRLHGKATDIVAYLNQTNVPFDIYTTVPGGSMLLARMP